MALRTRPGEGRLVAQDFDGQSRGAMPRVSLAVHCCMSPLVSANDKTALLTCLKSKVERYSTMTKVIWTVTVTWSWAGLP